MENPKSVIKEIGRQIGLTALTFISPQPFKTVEGFISLAGLEGFVETEIAKRLEPQQTMPGIQTIITAILPYQMPAKHNGQKRAGVIYSGDAAFHCDYHQVIMERLNRLAAFITSQFNCNCLAFSDTGPLIDRELIARGGAGFYGRNHCIIHKPYGSLFFIGYLLLDRYFEPDPIEPEKSHLCTACGRCEALCPTGAIAAGRPFAHTRCISYLTQKKGTLRISEMKAIGDSLYGCMRCQMCCPYNEGLMNEDLAFHHVDPVAVLKLTGKQARLQMSHTAAGWLGKTRLLRNAMAVLANIRYPDASELIEPFTRGQNPVLADTAHKAIRILKGEG